MIRSLYTAATGMVTQRNAMDVVTNNLANVDTVGYKSDEMISRSFADMMITSINASNGNSMQAVGALSPGTHIDQIHTSFTQGPMDTTDESTDLAIEGEGFFVVSTPQGNRYTRAGNFSVNADGKLVNSDGYFVLGTNGQITVGGQDFKVDGQGNVTDVAGAPAGTIQVVTFNNTDALTKQGANLYAGGQPIPANATVNQGMLESSNVDIAREMSNLILVNRAFEANQRMVKMLDESLGKTVNEIADF